MALSVLVPVVILAADVPAACQAERVLADRCNSRRRAVGRRRRNHHRGVT